MSKLIYLSEFISDYKTVLEVLTEGEGADKNYFLSGIWCQSELWNGNVRWYQKHELESEKNRHNVNLIPAKRCVGELDHSKDTNIQMHRMSHKFDNELSMEGNNIIGKARVLNTQFGMTLKVIIDEGIPFGVSSKGMGSTSVVSKENKTGTLISNYEMRTPGDVVWEQSAPDAKPSVIVEKFMEMVSEGDTRMESIFNIQLIEDVKTNLKVASKSQLEETKKKMFSLLMNIEL